MTQPGRRARRVSCWPRSPGPIRVGYVTFGSGSVTLPTTLLMTAVMSTATSRSERRRAGQSWSARMSSTMPASLSAASWTIWFTRRVVMS